MDHHHQGTCILTTAKRSEGSNGPGDDFVFVEKKYILNVFISLSNLRIKLKFFPFLWVNKRFQNLEDIFNASFQSEYFVKGQIHSD